MTDPERRQEFMVAYRELMQRTGYQVTPAIENKRYGPAVMVEPVAHIAPVPDWQPPAPVVEDETEDTKE